MADKKEKFYSSATSNAEAAGLKRNAQLKRWQNSETNKQPEYVVASRKQPKVKFDDTVVFLAAAQSGDTEDVERLVNQEQTDVNCVNKDGLTALHQCCIDDDLDMVRKLVELGGNIDIQDNEGWTPLHAAASCGHEHIVKFLLEQGAFPTPITNEGDTPYDLAEDHEVIRNMIEEEIQAQGINVDDVKRSEETIMLEDANKLIDDPDRPVVISVGGATPLHVAAAKDYTNVLKVLLTLKDSRIDIDSQDDDGWTALHAAVYWGNMNAAELLVSHGADVNQKTRTGETIDDLCNPDSVNDLELLRKLTVEQNNRHRRNAISTKVSSNRPSLTHQHSRDKDDNTTKPSPQIKRRPSKERSMFPKLDMAKEKQDLAKLMMSGTQLPDSIIRGVDDGENCTEVVDNELHVHVSEDLAQEDCNSAREALDQCKDTGGIPLASSESSSNESIQSSSKKGVGKYISSPKLMRKKPGMSPQMLKRVNLWESQSNVTTPTTNSVTGTPTPIASSTPSNPPSTNGMGDHPITTPSITSSAASKTSGSDAKRFSFQARTITLDPSGKIPRSNSVDYRSNPVGKSLLSSIGKHHSVLNSPEDTQSKRGSYDETHMKVPKSELTGSKASSLPRSSKISNREAVDHHRVKVKEAVSSEGAATANSLTTEDSRIDPNKSKDQSRDYSRETSLTDESETSRRSRARKTRQSRQVTQPVPADILNQIIKHDEEQQKSHEESSSDGSMQSTPPQRRRDADKTSAMSAYKPPSRPSARQTKTSASQQQASLAQPSSKKTENATAATKEIQEESTNPQITVNSPPSKDSVHNDISITEGSEDKSPTRSRTSTSGTRRRPREKRKATGITFEANENEAIPENLSELFHRKSSGDKAMNNSDLNSQSSSKDIDSLRVDSSLELSTLLSEEQDKNSKLEKKIASLKKEHERLKAELESKTSTMKDMERDLEKSKNKVSELNRRYEDATRAYEQEKKEKEQRDIKIAELESSSRNLQDLKKENQRLKDENSALIRVIGKLSRAPVHHQTQHT